jgi:hypothetical protein
MTFPQMRIEPLTVEIVYRGKTYHRCVAIDTSFASNAERLAFALDTAVKSVVGEVLDDYTPKWVRVPAEPARGGA